VQTSSFQTFEVEAACDASQEIYSLLLRYYPEPQVDALWLAVGCTCCKCTASTVGLVLAIATSYWLLAIATSSLVLDAPAMALGTLLA
jgi:hypothetical protein